jgi:heparinase II/III-like protein
VFFRYLRNLRSRYLRNLRFRYLRNLRSRYLRNLRFRYLRDLSSSPAPAILDQPKSWDDELRDAGITEAEFTARRLSRDALYVNVAPDRLERLRSRDPQLAQSTIAAAERVLRHEFDLLGSGPFTPNDPDRPAGADGYQPIDWHLDPVSGLRFPASVPLPEWDFARHRPPGSDIKLPWELARSQHWAVLGQAYQLTRDNRFALEIASELRDFVAANPVATGVNWTCTMDVALRAANWAIGLELVRSCPALPAEFWRQAYRSLYDHGTFIETHLENFYEVTSNHFFSNIVGLFFLAAVFDDLPRGRLWDRQCRAWLVQEMKVQVLADGADYESSVPYHRLMAELCLGASRLADYRGEPLPGEYRDRLRRMMDFLAAVQRPDGLLPQIGDADDGRLHILSGYGTWQPQDGRHVLAPAARCFDAPEWDTLGGPWGRWEAAWWGFDPGGPASEAPAVRNSLRHFPDAGLTVIRTERHYLIVSNGIVGTGGFGNHKHNDQLSFELHVDGAAVFVDPGSYVYTPDPAARNFFRSTQSHNTVVIDGEEQNEFRQDWLFRMFEKAHPAHLAVKEGRSIFQYRGRHQGYTRFPNPVIHERTFTLSRHDGILAIVDVLKGRGVHRLQWCFHVAPGAEVTVSGGRVDIRTGAAHVALTPPEAFTPTLLQRWYSPSYGVRVPCPAIVFAIEDRIGRSNEYVFRVTVQ